MPGKQQVPSFIGSTFRSVWSLELLLFLRKHRGRSFSREDMVAGLRASELIVAQSLDGLVAAGLVSTDEQGHAQYAPASPDLDDLVTETEAVYLKSPDSVRRTIVAAANSGATAFADAFRLRKD